MAAHTSSRPRRRLLVFIAVLLVAQLSLGVSGAVLFAAADSDPPHPVDAIVVLGGEHDGREAYGLELAREGLAPVVMLSDPYQPDDAVMARACRSSSSRITVICQQPEPSTTRGEAIMARRAADERGWRSIAVVSWRYHLPRARFIFDQCFSDRPGALSMRAVPRRYNYSLARWQFTFLYQYAGFAKAAVEGSCQ